MNTQTNNLALQDDELHSAATQPSYLTLCDLIDSVSILTEDDDNLTAKIVAHMVNSGIVKFIGCFKGRKLIFV